MGALRVAFSPARRRRSDRGSALVEAAITTPILLLLLFAIFELGLAMRAYLSVSSGVRDSARLATVEGSDLSADFKVLQNLKVSMKGIRNSDVLSIVVFKGTSSQSTTGSGTLATCRTSSITNLCNHYSASDLTRPSSDFGCGPGSPDRFWCPSSRKTSVAGPPDYIGVYVQVQHQGPTSLANITKTIDDEIVMRIEPDRLV